MRKIKKTFRFGKDAHERLVESVADHQWRLFMMAYTVSEELDLGIDRYHAAKMVGVHDLGEYVKGDVDERDIARGKVSKEEKRRQEEQAFEGICAMLPPKLGDEIYCLWREFEEGSTPEAKYVRALDRIEALLTIVEAGHAAYNMPDLIPNHADAAVRAFPQLSPMLARIKAELKAEFKKGNIPWKKGYDSD
jgi:putative hydrolase of HD superfamily